MKRKKKLSLTRRRAVTGFLFVLPWFLGFVLFYVRSLVMNFRYAVSDLTIDASTGAPRIDFTGIANLKNAFLEHGSFNQTLLTSMTNMLVDVPLIIFFSLFMAMLLNRKFKGRGLVRAIFFLPIILSGGAITDTLAAAAATMAGGVAEQSSEITSTASGALAFDVDYLIETFMRLGLPAKALNYVTSAVGRINDIIQASGVQIILFIAALQSIPGSMYEVSKIEGATGYETFWKVTFPMVMPHIITNVVYTIVDNFTNSDVIKLAYDSFMETRYGLSAVFALSSTAITVVILLVIVGIIQKYTFYYN